MELIPNKAKKLWDGYNIRIFIIISLSFQTFLILFAPLRKRNANKFVILSIWAAYLLADWAANFAVGLIANSQDDSTSDISEETVDLLAFWTPFLLLHLGGPDTITAFALEDNELWLRHLLGFLVQLGATMYVFSRSLQNKLWVPTILLFLAGIIKYFERTRALYLASLGNFRESMFKEIDPGPDYAKLVEEFSSRVAASLPTRIEMSSEPVDHEIEAAATITVREGNLNDIEVVQHAYYFFQSFKGLIVDLTFSFDERNESRRFLLTRSAKDAFRIIEVELNFIYQVLYTKAVVVHCLIGYIFRCISFSSVMAALGIFYFEDKHGFNNFDIGITYTLLLGAIAMDLIGLFMLFFSDWKVVHLKKPGPLAVIILRKFLAFKQTVFRRWSGYVSTYNLIDYCVKERPRKFQAATDYFRLKYFFHKIKQGFGKIFDNTAPKAFVDQICYVHNKPLTEQLMSFIFYELQMKSQIAAKIEIAKEMCEARGDWVLCSHGCTNLRPWIDDIDFHKSLLLWHIATELCYNDEKDTIDNEYRGYSKILSDYMLYLLVMQSSLMSAVAGVWQPSFRETCADAKRFFSGKCLEKGNEQTDACEEILKVNTNVLRPADVKGDRSNSVFFDACVLAKQLKKLNQRKWEIMSKVWLEMLCYAAIHCRAVTHAQHVSKGGELGTFVWLLMTHFGLSLQFEAKKADVTTAKLIARK